MLSYAAHAINLMHELIYGVNTLSEINERLPLVNVARIYFAILFSVEAAHNRFDYARISVDNTKGSSKIWMMKLFRE